MQKDYPHLSASKIRRVYVKEGFSLFKKPRKRMKNNPSNPIMIPLQRNEEWAIDFMSDVLANRRQFRTFNVIDHYNREGLGILTQLSIPATKATSFLDRLIEKYGKPKGYVVTTDLKQCRSGLVSGLRKIALNGVLFPKRHRSKMQL